MSDSMHTSVWVQGAWEHGQWLRPGGADLALGQSPNALGVRVRDVLQPLGQVAQPRHQQEGQQRS